MTRTRRTMKRERVASTVDQSTIAQGHGDGNIMEIPRTMRRTDIDRVRAGIKAEARVPIDPGGTRTRVKANEAAEKETTESGRAIRVAAMRGVVPQHVPREGDPGRCRVHVHGLHHLLYPPRPCNQSQLLVNGIFTRSTRRLFVPICITLIRNPYPE